MQYRSLNLSVATGALAAVFAYAPLAEAAVIMTDPGDNRLRNNGTANYNGSLGYVFTINTADDIRVTHLGVWDGPGTIGSTSSGTVGDGLEVSSKVVIYEVGSVTGTSTYTYTNGGEVISGTVPAGTAGTLLDEFRFVSLPGEGVILDKDKTYQIVMESQSAGNAFLDYKDGNNVDATIDDDFYVYPTVVHGSHTSNHPNFTTGGTNNGRQGGAYAGPNFQYTVVPEPATLAVMGLGAAMLMGRRRRCID